MYPPLFLRLIDASKDPTALYEQLKKLRADYSDLRNLRRSMVRQLKGVNKLKDREDIIKEWDEGWGALLKNEFRKQSFLRRKISSSELAGGVVSPKSDGIKTIFANVLEHWRERKLTRKFGFFEVAQEGFDNIELDFRMLKKLRIKGVKYSR